MQSGTGLTVRAVATGPAAGPWRTRSRGYRRFVLPVKNALPAKTLNHTHAPGTVHGSSIVVAVLIMMLLAWAFSQTYAG